MAYDFNGTSQYLSTSTAPVTAVPATLACWFNCDNVTAAQIIVFAGDPTTSARLTLQARGDIATDPVRLTQTNSDGLNQQFAGTTSGYSASTWAHGAGATSSTSSRTAYINGGSSATDTNALTGTAGTWSALHIAAQTVNAALTNYYDGRAAECAIWNVALTAAEIASLGKGFKPYRIRPQSLVFYAPLIRNIQDTKGGRTITNNNTATVAAHPRVI